MQKLLEQKIGGIQPNSTKTRLQLCALAACIGLAAYCALFLLPLLSSSTIGEAPTDPRDTPRFPRSFLPPPEIVSLRPRKTSTAPVGDTDDNAPAPVVVATNKIDVVPWGYNKQRNIPRYEAIHRSILNDVKRSSVGTSASMEGSDVSGSDGNPDAAFTLVDYGSDQGFFGITLAASFPRALVMSVEAGGRGGEIWSKDKHADVLAIQEAKIAKHNLRNVVICQAFVQPRHFTELEERGCISRYQLVLSVFHWFNLTTQHAFVDAVTTMFRNAKTTFIELPIMGDRGKLIRKQVGYSNFVQWYEGYDTVEGALLGAAGEKGMRVNITKVASVPWLRWHRDVLRVDLLDADSSLVDGPAAAAGGGSFRCEDRMKVYGCAPRPRYSSCPQE